MKRVWSSIVDELTGELFLISVKFPKGNDLTEVIIGYKRFRFPNCGGKIEGKHISIIALSEYHVDYMNRKGRYSVIMQGEPYHRCDVFVCFCCFTSHVNSYGHCGTVSSLNHTFSWAGLSKRLTSNLCTYFRL